MERSQFIFYMLPICGLVYMGTPLAAFARRWFWRDILVENFWRVIQQDINSTAIVSLVLALRRATEKPLLSVFVKPLDHTCSSHGYMQGQSDKGNQDACVHLGSMVSYLSPICTPSFYCLIIWRFMEYIFVTENRMDDASYWKGEKIIFIPASTSLLQQMLGLLKIFILFSCVLECMEFVWKQIFENNNKNV